MKKILLSLISVAAVAALVFGATQAFFSDTETSTGNSLVAGAIDLKIDSQCTYNGQSSAECGTWNPVDLTNEKFFNFIDLKPGDQGENTISLDLSSNPAHACVIIENMHDDDLGLTEPEGEDGDADTGADNGELAKELHFFTWAESDCNNEWNDGEPKLFSNVEGPASDVLNSKSYYLGKVEPGRSCIGVYWCYGNMTVGGTNPNSLSCSGASVDNQSQTDKLTADIKFYVEQYRNNPTFQCPKPTAGIRKLVLENEIINPQSPWTPIIDGTQGLLTWNGNGPTFDYTFQATGLQVSTAYKLIYSPDPWPQSLGVLNLKIANFVSDAGGVIPVTAGSINLGYDIPSVGDANYALGAKIWLVLATDHNDFKMTGWNPASYLFEGNVYINYDDTDI